MWHAASLHFCLLAEPFEEGDGGGVGDVEGTGGAWDGDVNHHVALLQYFLADAVAFVADDEGRISGKRGFEDICSIRCGFDCNDFFICGNQFSEVVFLGEIPFYIVATRGGAFSHSSEAVFGLGTEKYHLQGTYVVG